jgi:electron transfer flavoprotein beta subunit
MKILVCITHVPDTTSRIAFVENNTKFDTENVQYIIGPYDDYAISKAVDLKASHQATVTVLNVGLSESDPTLRRALAIGADQAIRVNAFPADSYYVARQIAEVIRKNQYDLILMGRESIDFNGGIVHSLVGEMVSMATFSPVMEMKIEGDQVKLTREIEGGKEYIETRLPLIAGCQEPLAEWKIPNMRGIMTARTKPFEVTEPVDAEIRVKTENFSLPSPRGAVKLIDPENVDELVDLLMNEAKVI